MLPKNRITPHPGRVLQEDFLEPLEISQLRFSKLLGIPFQRVNEIVNGKRGISSDTAWLFSQAFGTTPEFWMNLQTMHDLTKNRPTHTVKRIVSGRTKPELASTR